MHLFFCCKEHFVQCAEPERECSGAKWNCCHAVGHILCALSFESQHTRDKWWTQKCIIFQVH